MSTNLSAGRVRSTYEFIKGNKEQFSVQAMCRILGVAPSGYYSWLIQPLSNRAQEDARLVRLIRASFTASQGIYGAPRVFLDLREAGETCSRHRVARLILERRPHPEQGSRACLGLMRLGRTHGMDRLDAACARAERLRSYSYRTVEHILTNQQDRLPLDEPAPARPTLTHENLRGAHYYEEAYADTPDDRQTPRPPPDGDGHGL